MNARPPLGNNSNRLKNTYQSIYLHLWRLLSLNQSMLVLILQLTYITNFTAVSLWRFLFQQQDTNLYIYTYSQWIVLCGIHLINYNMCEGSNHYFSCNLRFYYSILSHNFISSIQSKQTFERLMWLLWVFASNSCNYDTEPIHGTIETDFLTIDCEKEYI